MKLKKAWNSGYLRSLVVGVDTKVPIEGGFAKAINFDNAATTPPLYSVMDAIVSFAPWCSSVHRGKGYKSVLTSELYDEAREIVKQFVKAGKDDVVIFTKNTTESINLLAHTMAQICDKNIVLTSDMEHLANDLPWRSRFQTEYICLDENGRLSISDAEEKLKKHTGRVALIAVAAASNVTGYVNPVHELAALAHRHGAKIFVDGAQLVPHMPFAMNTAKADQRIDFMAFSAHKMYAPFGTGILIGPGQELTRAEPLLMGGGAVDLTSQQFVEWDIPPGRFEAGTPNVMGVLALVTAIKSLSEAGLAAIHEYEHKLIRFALEGLSTIPGLAIYSTTDRNEARVSLVSFSLAGMDHGLVAQALSQEAGIAVRNGLFCAHPYVEKLLKLSDDDLDYYHTHDDVRVPGLVRISFGLYNTMEEVELFIKTLRRIAANPLYYNDKYKDCLRLERCLNPLKSEFC